MIIRAQQMRAFEETARRQFEEEMVAHSKDFAPPLCQIIGDEQLRVPLRSAIERARKYGFTYRGPVRLFIELMFLCGSAFDTDPQYAAIGEVSRASGDQMERAQQIHVGSLDYMDKVSGPAAANVHKALRDLLVMTRTPFAFSDRKYAFGSASMHGHQRCRHRRRAPAAHSGAPGRADRAARGHRVEGAGDLDLPINMDGAFVGSAVKPEHLDSSPGANASM